MSGNTQKNLKGKIGRADGGDESLFFIAIVPPEELQQEVTRLKEEVRDRFGSKHALNAPPHITLHMPFRLKPKKMNLLEGGMQQVADTVAPFEIQLKGFGSFAPRVIFIDVVECSHLMSVQKLVAVMARRQLGLDNAGYKDLGFHPHMTIAFRDLKKSVFLAAWQAFENRLFEATFPVNKLSILRYRGGVWQMDREFALHRSDGCKI